MLRCGRSLACAAGGLRCLAALLARTAQVVPGAEGTKLLDAVVVAGVVDVGGVEPADLACIGALVLALVLVPLEDDESPMLPVGRERDSAGTAGPAGHGSSR